MIGDLYREKGKGLCLKEGHIKDGASHLVKEKTLKPINEAQLV